MAVSSDGACGATANETCQGSTFGNCCSQYGWCGSTSAYCGTGCQAAYGTCSVGGVSSQSSGAVTSVLLKFLLVL